MRQPLLRTRLTIPHFNPRTREGCDAPCCFSPEVLTRDFNPRTREGCDGSAWYLLPPTHQFQSTHPRRVRRSLLGLYQSLHQFQSTHPRRVRPKSIAEGHVQQGFQSTHPRRVRRSTNLSNLTQHSYFNPRTREGCDWLADGVTTAEVEFQSTHPRRVRRNLNQLNVSIILYFNPRTREGCDMADIAAVADPIPISIHAPAKGATFSAEYTPS